MLMLINIMDIGIYHEILSDKLYYKQSHTKYASVPFGEYQMAKEDSTMVSFLNNQKKNPNGLPYVIASINGNIRAEKNYDLAIKALPYHPDVKLLIAGRAANSGVDTNVYRALATELGVADRLIWLERFLSDEELSAVLATSDIILLAYSASFKSQSAIFASLIPFSSNLVASEGENALAKAVRNYELGELVVPDDLPSLVDGIERAKAFVGKQRPGWKVYKKENSWQKNAETIWQLALEAI
jgi:glycosyltransferase involved in cell wall biosynthesis